MDLVEVLSFLLMMSTMELGKVSHSPMSAPLCRPLCSSQSFQDYSTENLSATQKAMLEDLRDYGLIKQRTVCVINGFSACQLTQPPAIFRRRHHEGLAPPDWRQH